VRALLESAHNFRAILVDLLRMRPDSRLLVISDTHTQSVALAYVAREVGASIGLEATLALMDPVVHEGGEPPPCVAAAMKEADLVLEFAETRNTIHSAAHRDALASGARHYVWNTDVSRAFADQPLSAFGLEETRKTTEELSARLTQADTARLATTCGTDLTMSLKGRSGIPIHPTSDARSGGLPFYAEAAIAPVEGTTEGTAVVDASVRGWGYVLRIPIRFEVVKGKAQIQSISSSTAQAEQLRRLLQLDENAVNCAAELGIGCSAFPSKILRGDFSSDYAMAGNVHIAFGANDSIGGNVHSCIHNDLLMTDATLSLDSACVVKLGTLLI